MSELRYEDVASNPLFLALARDDPRVAGHADVGYAAALASARHAAARDLPRGELSAAIVARLVQLGAPDAALASARRLAEPGVVVVVAGQQPGLFGGPHLVLGKALLAVAVARRLEADGVAAVPVFWSAAEDHDHGEADHVSLLAQDGSVERIRVALPEDGRMLADVAATEAADLLAPFLEGPHAEAVLELVRLRDGDSVGDSFARTILGLVGRFGVALVEPATLRRFASAVLEHEFAQPGRLASDVREAEARLVAAGFAAPLDLEGDALFFRVRDGARHRIAIEGGAFVERGGAAASPEEFAALLRADPQAFSWNVVTRVLAQDVALPVAAQVCGPAELGYASLTGASHDRLGVPRPALIPRVGVTFVDRAVARRCGRLGVEGADVVRLGARAIAAAAGPAEPPEVAAAREAVARLPQGTSRAVVRRRGSVLREMERYAAALAKEHTEADGAFAARRGRVLAALRPSGALQERKLSALPWIARFGPAMVDAMLEGVARDGAEHVLLPTGAGEEAT